MNLVDYIKDLAPELQEKIRACSSTEELISLAKEAKVPVPDEVLAVIAGGDQPDPENCNPGKVKCPKCGSTNVEPYYGEENVSIVGFLYKCKDCGNIFSI